MNGILRSAGLRGVVVVALFGLVMACCQAAPVPAGNLVQLLSELPTTNSAESRRVVRELTKLGGPGLREMIQMLAPRGSGRDDASVRRAIHELAYHMSRPGADRERRLFTSELARAVSMTTEPEIRGYLIEELQAGGDRSAFRVLIPLLKEPAFTHSASRAMLKLDPSRARRAFHRALESATTATQRTLVQALGQTKDPDMVPVVAPYVNSNDRMLRLEALLALAGIGTPAAARFFDTLPSSNDGYVAARETAALLLYARRLAAHGHANRAVAICRRLLDTPLESGSDHEHCAAIGTLSEILGPGVQPYLLKAMDSPSREVRAAALKQVKRESDSRITGLWVERMGSASPEVKAEILGLLGELGNATAAAAVVDCLDDPTSSTRLAAVRAIGCGVGRLGRPEARDRLLAYMKSAPQEELAVVRGVLSTRQDPSLNKALAAASRDLPFAARDVAFQILAARGADEQTPTLLAAAEETDPAIRVAALRALDKLAGAEEFPKLVSMMLRTDIGDEERAAARKALLNAAKQVTDGGTRTAPLLRRWDDANSEGKLAILDVLASFGGPQALETISSSALGTDERLRDRAVRLLAEWPDTAAAPDLMKIARHTTSETLHAIALRGYIRLAGSEKLSADTQLGMSRDALSAARRTDERKQVLSLVSTIKTTGALELASPLLSDDALKQDAAQTICLITIPQKPDDPALSGPVAAKALASALEVLKDDRLIRAARTRLVKLNSAGTTESAQLDEMGFRSLFNGKDLTGWIGATNTHKVENGVIVCPEGTKGNLFTKKEYADFDFRFDFKLGPGGNNGVGIRSPLEGEPAYTGMEIQILDDTHEKWRDLKPWQLHGGIYGVAAAKSGRQKPIGEWNTQEIIARGPQIEVILNGEEILDVNLDDIPTSPTVDNSPHPGLHRSYGHIGFLGHNDRVEFRNVSICEFK